VTEGIGRETQDEVDFMQNAGGSGIACRKTIKLWHTLKKKKVKRRTYPLKRELLVKQRERRPSSNSHDLGIVKVIQGAG